MNRCPGVALVESEVCHYTLDSELIKGLLDLRINTVFFLSEEIISCVWVEGIALNAHFL